MRRPNQTGISDEAGHFSGGRTGRQVRLDESRSVKTIAICFPTFLSPAPGSAVETKINKARLIERSTLFAIRRTARKASDDERFWARPWPVPDNSGATATQKKLGNVCSVL